MDRYGLLCRNIYENRKITQREMAAALGLSLGTCNRLIREGQEAGLFSYDPESASYTRGAAPKIPDGQRGDPGGGLRLPLCSVDL